MKKILISLLLVFTSASILFGQNDFSIKSVEVYKEYGIVKVAFSCPNSSILDYKKLSEDEFKEKVKVLEKNPNSGNRFLPVNVCYQSIQETDKLESKPGSDIELNLASTITISVALDHSGSMDNYKLKEAKKAIEVLINTFGDDPNTEIWLSTFHNSVSSKKVITKSNYKSVLDAIKPHANPGAFDTDLHYCIINKMEELKTYGGEQKMLIILSDGEHDINKPGNQDPAYKNGIRKPNTPDDVFNNVSRDNYADISLITIGFGSMGQNALNFLKKTADKSKNSNSQYMNTINPEKLEEMFGEITETVKAGFILLYCPSPNDKKYSGGLRTVSVEFPDLGLKTEFNYSKGSSFDFVELEDCNCPSPTEKFDDIIIEPCTRSNISYGILMGLALLILIFIVLVILFPAIQRSVFKSKHVKKFRPVENVTETCPYCRFEFIDGEEIVQKCEHKMHLSCWESNNNQCTEYPLRCKDGHQPKFNLDDIVKQKGSGAYMAWLFMGALGAMFAFILKHLFIGSNPDCNEGYAKLITGLLDTLSIDPDLLGNFYSNTFIGIALGFFLTLSFALIEEFKRKINAQAIGKVLIRALIGAVAGFIIMLIASLVGTPISEALSSGYPTQLISWVLFGTLLGASLSIGTTMQFKNCLIGGIIASIIGFHVYYFVYEIFKETAALVSWMLFGAILGFVVSMVVSMLEKFKLTVENGDNAGKDFPISKWLQSGLKVYVGSENTNNVVIDWEKEVAGRQARMEFDQVSETVVVINLEETPPLMLNNRSMAVDKPYKLSEGDILTFGLTNLKYTEQRANG